MFAGHCDLKFIAFLAVVFYWYKTRAHEFNLKRILHNDHRIFNLHFLCFCVKYKKNYVRYTYILFLLLDVVFFFCCFFFFFGGGGSCKIWKSGGGCFALFVVVFFFLFFVFCLFLLFFFAFFFFFK